MLNSVSLCGRVGQDIELKSTPNGKYVTTFSLAVGRDFSANGETDWVSVVAWDKTAEFVKKYFPKGRMMIVNGRLQTRSWETPDGKKRSVTEVVAEKVYFAGDKTEKTNTAAEDNSSINPEWFEEIANEPLPF